MHPHIPLFSFLAISCLLFAPLLCAQDNPLNDPDLKEMLKEAQEMQKEGQETAEPSGTRHKEETRGNAIAREGTRSTTGAGGKT
jgi:hypothetical protein